MKTRMMALAVLAGLAAGAQAQTNLYFLHQQELDIFTDYVDTENGYIGNNPTVAQLVGDRLFVAGYRNNNGLDAGGNPLPAVASTAEMIVINITDFATGARTSQVVPNTRIDPMPTFRGFYGLTNDFGPANSGLVLNYDSGGQAPGSYKLFDITTQVTPILLESSTGGIRGGAGSSFDYGFDGLGFDLNGDTVKDGPVLGVVDFTGRGGVENRGPFGIRIRESSPGAGDALRITTGTIYNGNTLTPGGQPAAPILNVPGVNNCVISGTLWRDIAIDPRNGTLAARATNDLVISTRNSDNGTGTLYDIDLNGGCGGGTTTFAFSIMQRVEAIYNAPDVQDFFILNDYGAAAGTVEGWTKAYNYAGQPVSLNFLNGDGSAWTRANTGGTLDYAWDPANRRLAITDFQNRRVYIFTTDEPSIGCPCPIDYDNSGSNIPDIDDLLAFFDDFNNGSDRADVNCTGAGSIPDVDDILLFFEVFTVGCP